MNRDRVLAATAGLAVLSGAVIMLVALVTVPGSWLTGYVSAAGTAGQPLAVAYRSGLVLLSCGVALLGGSRRWPPVAGALLVIAAVLAGTSGVVPCTTGCPLPPFEATTTADVVHTAASILGMATLAATMAAIALTGEPRRAVRRLAVGALTLTVPLGAVLGLTMLFVGRGQLGATLERILLVVAVGWLVGTSLLSALPAQPTRRTMASNDSSTSSIERSG